MRLAPVIEIIGPDADGQVGIEVRLDPAPGGVWPAEDGPVPEGGIPDLDVTVSVTGWPLRFPASTSSPEGLGVFGTIATRGGIAGDAFRTTAQVLPDKTDSGGTITVKAVFLHGTRVSGHAERSVPLSPAPSPSR